MVIKMSLPRLGLPLGWVRQTVGPQESRGVLQRATSMDMAGRLLPDSVSEWVQLPAMDLVS